MTPQSILVSGLPGSGKTTFLAALWHTVSSREIPTDLRLAGLKKGNYAHLNEIARKWCMVEDQERTEAPAQQIVTMDLTTEGTDTVELTFPDLSGEDFRDMWEERDCRVDFVNAAAGARNLMFFVHADKIIAPRWVVDEAELLARLGMAADAQVPVEWSARMAPTQVQIVDILQLLRNNPFETGPGRLAFVFSAWDKVKAEQLTPAEFLKHRLPLVDQYLEANAEHWESRAYGVSAIGGDITPANARDKPRATSVAEGLREIEVPCMRIEVAGGDHPSHDLTTMLTWLLG